MNPAEALHLARNNGVHIAVAGDDLVLNAEEEPAVDVLEVLKRHKAGIVALLKPEGDSWTADDWQAYFDERAGIAQFDGGQSREEAERLALECCIAESINRNPEPTDPDRCAWCGRPDQDEHTVVPFGSSEHGHAWLHPECWCSWHNDRREKAQQALERHGIRATVREELRCSSKVASK